MDTATKAHEGRSVIVERTREFRNLHAVDLDSEHCAPLSNPFYVLSQVSARARSALIRTAVPNPIVDIWRYNVREALVGAPN